MSNNNLKKAIPNGLTLFRCLTSILLPVLIIYGGETGAIIAAPLLIVAGLSDYFDGFYARKYNVISVLGQILDPVADKMLVIGTIFVLWANNFIPLYVFTILIGRDVLILLGAVLHMSLITSNAPSPNVLGKITTGSQIVYIAQLLIIQAMNFDLHYIWLD